MAVLADIQQAIVDALNGGTWSLDFVAIRSYRPVFKREEMKDLHVTVVPGGCNSQRLSRGLVQGDYVVEIAVQQAVVPGDLAAMDSLGGLVEELGDFFLRAGRLAAYPAAACIGAGFAPGSDRGYAPEHLDELGQFTAILSLTFRLAR